MQFFSAEWIEAFDRALRGAEYADESGRSVRAESGNFSVEQQVNGVPGRDEEAGPMRMLLLVEDGRASVSQVTDDSARPDVVITLSYDDAAALSRGELDPTQALGAGRVQVRGDLSVLMAGQDLLAAAGGKLTKLRAETTY
ncbi:MAG: SCP2 sterol-binding domain-containing protein [Acidimicrobiales bacterium]